MILDALVNHFNQRFQHEKRARICLWFDERQEFARLLPTLRSQLASMKPPPFFLLEYDAEKAQGQIWLKHRIFRITEEASPKERKNLRFVLYLPVSEDRLESPGPVGQPTLDLLVEYKMNGIFWRINGKRPTLFSFLRQAGVALPDSPVDQRKLYDGGTDSVLSKYVAKFADRPAAYWKVLLSPELAKSRLVGDLDQTILDLAVALETTWQNMKDRGLDGEFIDMIREKYGFESPVETPPSWMRELVTVLALTETYIGYGEPADFPFSDRLPPVTQRQRHIELLQRWLRDTESRTAWDRWVSEVETRLDLSSWARGRQGLSFGFPHLVKMRWDEVWAAFEVASSKISTTTAFFEQYGDVIAKEAEYSKASYNGVGSWQLLQELERLLNACDKVRHKINHIENSLDLVRIYVESAAEIEQRHLQIRCIAEEHGLPAATHVADRAYAAHANALNDKFFKFLKTSGSYEIPDLPRVTMHLEKSFWHGARQAGP